MPLFLIVSAQIAHNVVKYFELSNIRKHTYKFSFTTMQQTRGHSAVYIMYAYARIKYRVILPNPC